MLVNLSPRKLHSPKILFVCVDTCFLDTGNTSSVVKGVLTVFRPLCLLAASNSFLLIQGLGWQKFYLTCNASLKVMNWYELMNCWCIFYEFPAKYDEPFSHFTKKWKGVKNACCVEFSQHQQTFGDFHETSKFLLLFSNSDTPEVSTNFRTQPW